MSTRDIEPATAGPRSRRELVRDVAVFQVKVIVDGFRDLLLVPLSLVAGAVSLLSGGREPGTEFYVGAASSPRFDVWRWFNRGGDAAPTTARTALSKCHWGRETLHK